MSNQKTSPKWWQVYVMLLAVLGLFWLEAHARMTGTDHVIAELGILALIFGCVRSWLKANRLALMESDPTEAGWGVGICDMPSANAHAALAAEDESSGRERDKLAAADMQTDLTDELIRESRGAASGAFAPLRLISKR